ncbi:methyltransferase domain-containing protein [Frankia sp. CNm7]|uniref:Methyltransferase domain-containing protein n=1 Tax=Frankia nepalensis TaxID=1836974 RepID=A0A937RIZ8_9ACTN|nr:methyltransferase domain-containing protein [Frankia nepalensis]MBL7498804.1 methyltransferase domain-containing protein [Frankia nepalensis]MBL7508609.1 methyltransferase domain-containing protein [Frankia nepalensis]MBL7517473.1 methyltransferase domain-containing protein [Frankia nepalensis]MBL7629719.1 methyltransferase domain-containing protein [Frankia nepalensis]
MPSQTAERQTRGPDRGRAAVPRRDRNDPAQYDDLADEWWPTHGRFAALRWLAAARATLLPSPPAPGAPLLDVACGAGLLRPHLTGRLAGWRHVGVDLSASAVAQARAHGVTAVRGDALRLPFRDASVSCVVAGEILEHLDDLDTACAELARVLTPGGTLVLDTLADTLLCRVVLVRIAERLPGGPPPRIHDPKLFVGPGRLAELLARHGVHLTLLRGLRPSLLDYPRWLAGRLDQVRMLPTRSTSCVYQARGEKTRGRTTGDGETGGGETGQERVGAVPEDRRAGADEGVARAGGSR